jgi:type IX secretion system PorP/SprF family membrane protein
MKKRLLAFSALILSATGLNAQQDILTTHFMYNKMTFNPGETGSEDGICGTMLYRNQWDRVNGAPNSAVLNVEADMSRWVNNLGVGITFLHDAIGFNRQNNLNLNVSYAILPRPEGELRLGVGLGMLNFGMSPVWVPPVTMFDASLPTNTSVTTFDANAGLYWKSNLKPWYVGLSSTHLAAPRLGLPTTTAGGVSYDQARHYWLMGGYKFEKLLGQNWDLEAQTIVRTELKEFSGDINVRAIYQNFLYGGVTYRTSDAVAFMVGGTYNRFKLGYSYDLTLNQLSGISRGSHEIMIGYCYYLPPIPRVKTKNVRYL